jgi:hypothetical protein
MISSPTCTIGGDGGSSFTSSVCELAFEKSGAELLVAPGESRSLRKRRGQWGTGELSGTNYMLVRRSDRDSRTCALRAAS